MDISGIQKVPGGGYVELPENCSYFANMEKHPCGIPAFSVRAANGIIAEDAAIITEEEAGQFYNAMAARLEECITSQIEKTEERAEEISVNTAKWASEALEKIIAVILDAWQDFEDEKKKILDLWNGFPEDLAALLNEPSEPPSARTVRDRKRERERRLAVERIMASKFRQQKAKESVWNVKKRTERRFREWRGEDRT